jgi:hypothetical protein
MNDQQTRTRFETLLLPLLKDAYHLTRWLMKKPRRCRRYAAGVIPEGISLFWHLPRGNKLPCLVPAHRAKQTRTRRQLFLLLPDRKQHDQL